MHNIGYFSYSHSEYDDLWDITFSQIEKHIKPHNGSVFDNYYLFTDRVSKSLPDWVTPVIYTDGPMWTEKTLECLNQIEDDYAIYTYDDNFIVGDVYAKNITDLRIILDTTDLCFAQLLRSGVPVSRFKEHGNDFLNVDQYSSYQNVQHLQDESRQYVGQPTLWDRDKFIYLLENNIATSNTAKLSGEKTRDLESPETHQWMIDNNIRGCYSWDPDIDLPLPPKNVTYRSKIFPTMNAVRRGRWYVTEHGNELLELLNGYDVNIKDRGVL